MLIIVRIIHSIVETVLLIIWHQPIKVFVVMQTLNIVELPEEIVLADLLLLDCLRLL
jgi:hypothetical protein